MKYDLEERTSKFGENVIDLVKKVKITTLTKSIIEQMNYPAASCEVSV